MIYALWLIASCLQPTFPDNRCSSTRLHPIFGARLPAGDSLTRVISDYGFLSIAWLSCRMAHDLLSCCRNTSLPAVAAAAAFCRSTTLQNACCSTRMLLASSRKNTYRLPADYCLLPIFLSSTGWLLCRPVQHFLAELRLVVSKLDSQNGVFIFAMYITFIRWITLWTFPTGRIFQSLSTLRQLPSGNWFPHRISGS